MWCESFTSEKHPGKISTPLISISSTSLNKFNTLGSRILLLTIFIREKVKLMETLPIMTHS